MTATPTARDGATVATPGVRLDFERIDRRLVELDKPTGDTALADLTGLDRSTVWRYRTDRLRPLLETAVQIADALGLKVDDLVVRVPSSGAAA